MSKPQLFTKNSVSTVTLTTAAVLLMAPFVHAITIGPGDNYTSPIYLTVSDHLEMTGGSIVVDGGGGPLGIDPALRLLDNSSAHITAGLIKLTNSNQWSTIQLEDNSSIVFDGGQIEGRGSTDFALLFEDFSSGTINGGSFFSDSGANSAVNFSGIGTQITINGGTFSASGTSGSAFAVNSNQGTVLVTGGSFVATGGINGRGIEISGSFVDFYDATVQSTGDGIFVGNPKITTFHSGSVSAADEALRILFGVVDIYGGSFNGGTVDISLIQSVATANIYVQSALLNGVPVSGPIAASTGTLSVVYLSGASEQLSFSRTAGTLNVIIIPEPSTATLAASIVALLASHRRRRG